MQCAAPASFLGREAEKAAPGRQSRHIFCVQAKLFVILNEY